jgi:ankyrin repeat protein
MTWSDALKWVVRHGDEEPADLQKLDHYLMTVTVHANAGPSGSTLLHFAVLGSVVVVRHLLRRGAPIDQANTLGATPLHWAARHANAKMVRVLLSNGAEVASLDQDGNTPLHYAAEAGNLSTLKELIPLTSLNHTNIYGRSPLRVACYEEETKAISLLVKSGARVPNSLLQEVFAHSPSKVYRALRVPLEPCPSHTLTTPAPNEAETRPNSSPPNRAPIAL